MPVAPLDEPYLPHLHRTVMCFQIPGTFKRRLPREHTGITPPAAGLDSDGWFHPARRDNCAITAPDFLNILCLVYYWLVDYGHLLYPQAPQTAVACRNLN